MRRRPLPLPLVLNRCRKRIPRIGTLIDVGASNGSWALQARKFFPEMKCFLIEAQQGHESALEKLKRSGNGYDYLIAAAGDTDGDVYFQLGNLFGGVASHSAKGEDFCKVPMVTLDSVVTSHRLEGPYLLKLDTHGFEVPIFAGAQQTLRETALIVVETYNFQLTDESLRFHELCSFLETCGFRCVDLSNPVFRKDGVLWQMDLLFMPESSPEFKMGSYF